MKGFVIRSTTWKNKTCNIAIPNEGVVVTINITWHSDANWNVFGKQKVTGESWVWKGGKLSVGDELEVTFADVKTITPPLKEQNIYVECGNEIDDVDLLHRKLERYYRLKAILEDENLIERR